MTGSKRNNFIVYIERMCFLPIKRLIYKKHFDFIYYYENLLTVYVAKKAMNSDELSRWNSNRSLSVLWLSIQLQIEMTTLFIILKPFQCNIWLGTVPHEKLLRYFITSSFHIFKMLSTEFFNSSYIKLTFYRIKYNVHNILSHFWIFLHNKTSINL